MTGGTPTPSDPSPSVPEAPAEPDPGSPLGRAMAHVTKLLDRPGRKDVPGYPRELTRPDDAAVTLAAGARPVLLVFYDDASRDSDLQAAQLLPMIVRMRDRIDFVAVDSSPSAQRAPATDELSLRFLDHVPTIVVLDGQRTRRLLRSGRVDAKVVQRAIEDAIDNPTPERGGTPAAGSPDVGSPDAGSPDAGSPDAGSIDPWQDQPGRDAAGGNSAGSNAGGGGEERGGVTFTPPGDVAAGRHVERLKRAPGDAKVPGYPSDLVSSAPAGRVLATGTKPCVVIFYDDTSKASDLQAAAYLPLLVRRQREVDLVLVDVGPKAVWNDDQKRVVRTYFNHYVPTTVVLTSARAPVKSWYSRVEASALDNAIDDALAR